MRVELKTMPLLKQRLLGKVTAFFLKSQPLDTKCTVPQMMFWDFMRNTDLGDYIYVYTLRTRIGNRTWKPRALLDVQFLHTFPAFCLQFCC